MKTIDAKTINELATKIIQLNEQIGMATKYAKEIATDDCVVIFNLTMTNKTKQAKDKKDIFGEDGSIKREYGGLNGETMGIWTYLMSNNDSNTPKDNSKNLSSLPLNATTAVEILHSYVDFLIKERDRCVSSLRSLQLT